MCHPPKGHCELAKVDPSRSESSSQQLTFSNLPKSSVHASGVWRHSHPWSHPLSGVFILTSVNDTSSPRGRQHLCSSLHQTNPCAKPKCKIYKTKSLGHYITQLSIFSSLSNVRARRKYFSVLYSLLTTTLHHKSSEHTGSCRDLLLYIYLHFSCKTFYIQKKKKKKRKEIMLIHQNSHNSSVIYLNEFLSLYEHSLWHRLYCGALTG